MITCIVEKLERAKELKVIMPIEVHRSMIAYIHGLLDVTSQSMLAGRFTDRPEQTNAGAGRSDDTVQPDFSADRATFSGAANNVDNGLVTPIGSLHSFSSRVMAGDGVHTVASASLVIFISFVTSFVCNISSYSILGSLLRVNWSITTNWWTFYEPGMVHFSRGLVRQAYFRCLYQVWSRMMHPSRSPSLLSVPLPSVFGNSTNLQFGNSWSSLFCDWKTYQLCRRDRADSDSDNASD